MTPAEMLVACGKVASAGGTVVTVRKRTTRRVNVGQIVAAESFLLGKVTAIRYAGSASEVDIEVDLKDAWAWAWEQARDEAEQRGEAVRR